ncbi:MAG TPA: GDSL-type esterase/lipase family protein [Anaeromyxobacteraceae bacterium]
MTRRLAAAAASAVLLAAAGAWLADPPRRARLWRRVAPPRPPDRFGGPLVPAPLVSRGRPVFSSPPGGKVLVDGLYRADSWHGGFPSPERPAWAAVKLGPCCGRVLLSWTSSHNHDWDERFYGAPEDYRLETSADSSDGADGTWRLAVEVRGNPVRSRAHEVPFAGQRWLRMAVTRLPAKVNAWGLHLDEIDVHDLSGGGNDVWVFLGDSITAGVFDRAPARQPSFAAWVARRHPAYFPAMIEAGKGRLHAGESPAWLAEVLRLVPAARVVAVGVGSNDWELDAYRADLSRLVRAVKDAGRIPVVARVPFRSDAAEDRAALLAAVVDRVAREHDLLPGPDLHAWFKAHPERLADHLHPDDAGAVEMSRLWAEAADPLYE